MVILRPDCDPYVGRRFFIGSSPITHRQRRRHHSSLVHVAARSLALLILVTHRTCRNATTSRDAEWPVQLLCLQRSPESDSLRHGSDMDSHYLRYGTDTDTYEYHACLLGLLLPRASAPPPIPPYAVPSHSLLFPTPRTSNSQPISLFAYTAHNKANRWLFLALGLQSIGLPCGLGSV
ncbi:hypothetical protein CKAH01_02291 [Colletotrichum kahawae]|uniref:Uncharacterized protein n=1 Tax=Colletotrichum kahawae TaxID=34407 RepID=A0AAD9XZV9_COLKA|nr:hypothetical protein CKAH01_02291 [Colletotrichum kahawae]